VTVHREQIVKTERKPTRCNNQMFIINFCLNMFRASLCLSSGEKRPCVTACGVLRWFCRMCLLAVVGRCVVGCEYCVASCWFSLSLSLFTSNTVFHDDKSSILKSVSLSMYVIHVSFQWKCMYRLCALGFVAMV